MKKEAKFSIFLNSVGGILLVLLCVVLFNIITAQFKLKADMTEGNLYTLSEGTEKLLDQLDKDRGNDAEASPLEIRLYITNDKGVPVFVNQHRKRIEDLLDQYQSYAGNSLKLTKINPRLDTDEEDAAISDGIRKLRGPANNHFYVGMAISYLDSTETLPFLDPNPSKAATLEYDISRAIKNVLQFKEDRQTLGIMSSLNVWGGPDSSNPMAMMNRNAPQQPAWIFLQQLQQDFAVERIEPAVTEIPGNVDVLMVIHPKNISEETEYALDQFVLRGGKLIAFVDPMALRDEGNNQNPQMRIPGMGGASNLTRLFGKWGVPFDGTKVVADYNYRLNPRDPMSGGRVMPGYLNLGKEALNENENITKNLQAVRLPYAGSFDTSKVATGLTATELMSSSEQAKLVDGMSSQFNGQQIMDTFLTGEEGKPADLKKYTMALRLGGKFTTAFPDGKPGADATTESEEKKENINHLTESAEDNHVCLIGDTDILTDEHFLLQQRLQISNNIPFIQNTVDYFGDPTLVSIRSRSHDRPFTTIQKLEKDAQERFENRHKELTKRQQEILQKKTTLQSTGEGSNQFTLSIDPEALKEIQEQEIEIRKELRSTRNQLRAEVDLITLIIKVANIGVMPLLVILFGIMFFVFKRKKTAAH
jgi:ABC-type uncharacterized transport system involved in gliding motility auxiliary subunit